MKKKKKYEGTWEVPKGLVVAFCLGDDLWGYCAKRPFAPVLYPFLSRGGFLPLKWLGQRNWRWCVSSPALPDEQVVATQLSQEENFKDYERSLWLEVSEFWTELVFPCARQADGTFNSGPPSQLDPDLRKVLLDRSDVIVVWPCDNLVDFVKSRLPEMTIIDRTMAPLLDSYNAPAPIETAEPIIEVWIQPELAEPEQGFEDFILETLMEGDLGVVGEYGDTTDYRFASCDVSDAAKAAKALLKVFKKAGYTTGMEIKERDGKQRVWTVG